MGGSRVTRSLGEPKSFPFLAVMRWTAFTTRSPHSISASAQPLRAGSCEAVGEAVRYSFPLTSSDCCPSDRKLTHWAKGLWGGGGRNPKIRTPGEKRQPGN